MRERKRKRQMAFETLETRRVLTAPTFNDATLLVLDGESGSTVFSGSSLIRQSANPELDGAATFDLKVTTSSDILVLDSRFEKTEGKNVPGGFFNEPPGGAHTEFDSWITTPGPTLSIFGWDLGDESEVDGELRGLSLFDVPDDGPQDEFPFARITLMPDSNGSASSVFSGEIQTSASPSPLFTTFQYYLGMGHTFSVPEAIRTGTSVGHISATDPDGDPISYEIVGGNDGGAFAVDDNTGEITTLQSLPASTPDYTLVLQATANGESTTIDVTINVLRQENAPVFPASQEFQVAEDAAIGSVIGTFVATDPDGDSLHHAIKFGDFGDHFAYDWSTGELSIAFPIDVEEDTIVPLELKATDSTGLSALQTVEIKVLAVAEELTEDLPPLFERGTVSIVSGGDLATFNVLGTYGADSNSIANAPLLDGAVTFDLSVSTIGDLSVLNTRFLETAGMNVPGGWFNDLEAGNDANPPLPGLFASSPQLAFDSWVTLPGPTAFASDTRLADNNGLDVVAFIDATDDRPQEDFLFARITLIPDENGNASAVFGGDALGEVVGTRESPFEYRLTLGLELSVEQDAIAGTSVGFAAASDPNGDEVTHAIVGGINEDVFEINSVTGEILTKRLLDESTYSLELEATANGQSTTTTVTINAINMNSAPVFAAANDVSVSEDAAVGTVLGTFGATDADGDSLNYRIVAGNSADFFAIDNSSGEISIDTAMDVDADTTFELDLQVTDTLGLSDTQAVSITVLAEDEPPVFDDPTSATVTGDDDVATFEILRTYPANAESIANNPLLAGAVTFDLAVTTPSDILVVDAGFSQTQGMNVPGGWFNDLDNGSDVGPPASAIVDILPEVGFDSWVTTPSPTSSAGNATLAGNNGLDVVTYFDTLDDGAQEQFTFARITLIPDANGNASAVFAGDFQLAATPETQTASFEYQLDLGQTLHVGQDAQVGATVGFVSASDLEGDEISYAIVGGNDGEVFEINSETGEIVTAQPLTAANYALVIQATANGQSATTTVTINVPENSGNSAPSFPSAEPIEISEDTAVGTVIGSLAATDPDGDALDYGIVTRRSGSSTPLATFAYDAQTGAISVAEPIEVQGNEVFEITLTATDPDRLLDSATIQVTVTDVVTANEPPTISDATFEIGNNVKSGDLVGTVTASDPNGDSLSYAIVSGNDDGLFAVDTATGMISATGSLVADTTHALVVRATDPGGLSVDSTVTVNVNEVDQTPVFDGSDTGAFNFGVPEGTSAGTSLGSLAATNPLGGTLQYAITESSAPGLFLLDEATGQLTLARQITSEDTAGVVSGNANFRLVVEARNSAGFAATATVVIVEGLPITDGTGGGNTGAANWQNSTDPLDVDNNGIISPIDALLVINELNKPNYHIAANGLLSIVETPPWFFDVTGDSYVSPVDALRVINHLNNPESQSAAGMAFAIADNPSEDDEDSESDSPFSDRLVDLAFE